MNNVSIIGAGSWGSALGNVLSRKGIPVKLWSRSNDLVEMINKTKSNTDKLAGVIFNNLVSATSDIEEALAFSTIILIAIPTQSIRENLTHFKNMLNSNKNVIVSCSKGIEKGTNMLISQIVEDVIGKNNFVVLSGPSHAEELAIEIPTTLVASSQNLNDAKIIQDLFMTSFLRVYTNDDIKGAEFGGALKNVIALCAGISDGLNYGDNTKAALITRGIAEIARLGVNLGAKRETFSGLTGLGDLIVTCTSNHSRNRRAGILFGQGCKLDFVKRKIKMVAEGIPTCEAAYELSCNKDILMPITKECYKIIFENKDPKEAVLDLMTRDKKFE